MRTQTLRLGLVAGLCLAASAASGHGLMEEPASRNWFCGAVTKPDQVANGTAAYPICGQAFASDFNGGYSFMSVLTHARGRAVVTPLPQHVCGFGSETWQGGATPWDQPINWPTNAMQSGRNKITWNISWGPHFDDTEEFRYWITKPGFVYQVGTPLSWNDFETAPFCSLQYRDSNPAASPDVVARKADQRFDTYCNVPARQGRHVIYGEWGRNQFTFERFHGCVDAVFSGGGTPTTPVARIGLTPAVSEVRGSSTLALSASGSSGANLSYRWTVTPASSLYQLQNASSASATLQMGNPAAITALSIALAVTNAAGTDTATTVISHVPAATGPVWQDLGAVSASARVLAAGDRVRLRLVDAGGTDVYLPNVPITLTASTAGASAWPFALAQAVNAASTEVKVGVLSGGTVSPAQNATSNRAYSLASAGFVSAFVEIVSAPPTGDCQVTLRSGRSPFWAGLDVATASAEVTLDFTGTSLDLSQVTVDPGVFQATVSGQLLALRKPSWVNAQTPGFFGLNASNYAPLATFTAPSCR